MQNKWAQTRLELLPWMLIQPRNNQIFMALQKANRVRVILIFEGQMLQRAGAMAESPGSCQLILFD